MQIERKALIEAIESVKPGVATQGSVSELRYIWWRDNYLCAYNGALGIKVPFECDLPAGGVPASALLGVLESSPSAEAVTLTAGSGMCCTVKVGRSTIKLPFLADNINPWQFPDTSAGAQATLPLTEELVDGLKRARVIKAKKPTLVEHHGVVLYPDKKFLSLFSTDSRTLVEVRVDGKFDRDLERIVLPHAYVQQLLGLTVPSTICIMADAIIAGDATKQVCSNMLDNTGNQEIDLPKQLDDLSDGSQDGIVMLPEGWGEALNRAMALAGSKNAYLKLEFASKQKELILTGALVYGHLQEHLPLIGKVPAGNITVELKALRALTRDAESLAIAEQALVIGGKNDELYLIAAHHAEEETRGTGRPTRRRAAS